MNPTGKGGRFGEGGTDGADEQDTDARRISGAIGRRRQGRYRLSAPFTDARNRMGIRTPIEDMRTVATFGRSRCTCVVRGCPGKLGGTQRSVTWREPRRPAGFRRETPPDWVGIRAYKWPGRLPANRMHPGSRTAPEPSAVVWRKTSGRRVYGAWRSPVARLLWEQEVPGSNPGAPIELTRFGAGRCSAIRLRTAGTPRPLPVSWTRERGRGNASPMSALWMGPRDGRGVRPYPDLVRIRALGERDSIWVVEQLLDGQQVASPRRAKDLPSPTGWAPDS